MHVVVESVLISSSVDCNFGFVGTVYEVEAGAQPIGCGCICYGHYEVRMV